MYFSYIIEKILYTHIHTNIYTIVRFFVGIILWGNVLEEFRCFCLLPLNQYCAMYDSHGKMLGTII